jgi:hypothetical protein
MDCPGSTGKRASALERRHHIVHVGSSPPAAPPAILDPMADSNLFTMLSAYRPNSPATPFESGLAYFSAADIACSRPGLETGGPNQDYRMTLGKSPAL